MTELLCIPFKQTLKLNLKEQLSRVIDVTSYQTSSSFDEDLTEISTVRDRICDSEVSETKLKDLKLYYTYLSELQRKFPDNEIEFTWFQTLSQKSYSCSQYSLKFEKLNVLYNIGSIFSLLALDANNGSSVALKKLCLYFQYSAGCFQYILNHVSDTKEPVFDENTGYALVNMMLAQAQECFWFKAIQDSHKDSLISRLAQQIVDYYDEALRYSKRSELIRGDWSKHLESKVNYFKAVTYYRNGVALGQKGSYGAMIRSLNFSVLYLNRSNLPSKQSFMTKVEEALKNAQRDNDFIYLQTVPSDVNLIKPAPMVLAIPITDFLEVQPNSGHVLFKDLLPIDVVESCSGYNERQDEYIRQHIIEPLRALNKLLKDNIPKFEIPPDVRTIPEEEMAQYDLTFSDQKVNIDRIQALIVEIEGILKQEAETDAQLRNRYGTLKWVLAESSSLNKPYYEKLQKLKDYKNQGNSVDSETISLFELIDRNLITSPIKIPESNDPTIREICEAVKKRDLYIKELASKSSEHRILSRIITEYKKTGETNFESVFREHIKYFDVDLRYVQEQKTQNKSLLEKLKGHKIGPEVKRMEPFRLYIEELEYSLKLLEDVKRNVEEGSKFYQELMKSANLLLSEVHMFETARRESKRQLEENISSGSQ